MSRARELSRPARASSTSAASPSVTNRPAVDADEEIERVVPVVEAVCALSEDVVVSVDTYKPAVAEAAVAAGASIVNDISGLRDPGLADVCARTGAALVLMHTRAAPKPKLLDPDLYDDVVEDVIGFLRERMDVAASRGVAAEQILLDPGPDFAKTPAQTLEVLARLEELHVLERPILLAVSRKDVARRAHRPRAARAPRRDARGARRRRRPRRAHGRASTTSARPPTSSPSAARCAASSRCNADLHLPEDLRRRGAVRRTRQVACDPCRGRLPLSQRGWTPTTRSNTFRRIPMAVLTARRSSPVRSPTYTRSPRSSASTASAGCARRRWSRRSSAARTPTASLPPRSEEAAAAEVATAPTPTPTPRP